MSASVCVCIILTPRLEPVACLPFESQIAAVCRFYLSASLLLSLSFSLLLSTYCSLLLSLSLSDKVCLSRHRRQQLLTVTVAEANYLSNQNQITLKIRIGLGAEKARRGLAEVSYVCTI